MVKYLTKKGLTFWYRRRIGTKEEVIFSLGTKNYDLAMLRHSYIDYKIQELIIKGSFEIMNTAKIRDIIDHYKKFIKSDEFIYGEEGRVRGKELALEIDGEFFGGHTQTALLHKLSQYGKISQSDDIEKVKAHTEPIIERNNTLKRELDKLEDKEERDYVHWKLLKAEGWGLNKAIKQQKKYFGAVEAYQIALTQQHSPKQNQNNISIGELTQRYIEELSITKEWSQDNEDDILFVLNIFEEYFSPRYANELRRNDFVNFRNKVLKKLPKIIWQNAFKDKTIHEILDMPYIIQKNKKKKEIIRIGLSTLNKHMGRVHQVFAWAANKAHIIDENYCADLRIVPTNKQNAKKKKTNKLPFSDDELKQWFEVSSNFTTNIKITLANKAEFVFIPLLALYTGAKNTELAQLHSVDIQEINGIWCFCFTDIIENPTNRKTFKTSNSLRTIPIAQGLIDLGFLLYVKKQKGKLLFPNIKYYGKEPSFTPRISEYITKQITQDSKKSFYSFRHLVNQKLKNTKTPLYIINDITGHNDNDHKDNIIDMDTYGDEQMPLEILQEVINKSLVYNEIDFSHIKEEIHRRYK